MLYFGKKNLAITLICSVQCMQGQYFRLCIALLCMYLKIQQSSIQYGGTTDWWNDCTAVWWFNVYYDRFLQNSFQNYFELLFWIFLQLKKIKYALRPSQQPTVSTPTYSQSIKIIIVPSDVGTIVLSNPCPLYYIEDCQISK